MDWIFDDEHEENEEGDDNQWAPQSGSAPSSFAPPPPRNSGMTTNSNLKNSSHYVPAAAGSNVKPTPKLRELDDVTNSTEDSRNLLRSLSEEERQVLPQTLNQMQHRVLPTVLGTDESVVLSAPTGAGKTCVLDMAILRSLLVDATSRIYYVAPSKALCRLQGQGFMARFRKFNLDVEVITGDGEDLDADEEEADNRIRPSLPASVKMKSMMFGGGGASAISTSAKTTRSSHRLIICTPEKLEAETRRVSDERLASNQRVVILVDEVHHLGERARGATLELVLSRFLWAFRFKRINLRFVCVSATIPNVSDVAQWLGHASYFEFHQRPVPLTVRVLGFPKNSNRSDFLFEQDLDRQVPDVLRANSSGKPALIFVSSRKGAKDLAVKLKEAGLGVRNPNTQSIVQAQDDTLAECLRWGIGFHSAALTAHDRAQVENLFRDGKLLVVCCTSTLAVGVDLPANLVIIKSTRAYRGSLLGFQDLERATMIQMIGRAGRPGFDTEGTAVIMTSQGEESKFLDLSNGLLAVSSQLAGETLQEGLNAEIVAKRLCSSQDCSEWWTMTFASVSTNTSFDFANLEVLSNLGCVKSQAASPLSSHSSAPQTLEAAMVGRIASSHHLKLATVAKYSLVCHSEEEEKEIQGRWDLQAVCRLICDSNEFDELIPRRDQKKFLNSIAWTTGRFKSNKSARVVDGKDAAFQLLQARLGGVALTDNALRQNSNLVLDRAPRLARALLKMLVDAKSNIAIVCALLCKCLDLKLWETDELGQLDGVGQKTKEKLQGMGLTTLKDALAPANASALPSKSITHARKIIQSKREPSVCFSDSALIISLGVPSAATNSCGAQARVAQTEVTMKKGAAWPQSSDWWLIAVGGSGNKILAWTETLERVVIPCEQAMRLLVFTVHRKSFGIDSKLICEADPSKRTIRMVSTESDSFWDGFFLDSRPPTTKVGSVPAAKTQDSTKTATKASKRVNVDPERSTGEKQNRGVVGKTMMSETMDNFISASTAVGHKTSNKADVHIPEIAKSLYAPALRMIDPLPGHDRPRAYEQTAAGPTVTRNAFASYSYSQAPAAVVRNPGSTRVETTHDGVERNSSANRFRAEPYSDEPPLVRSASKPPAPNFDRYKDQASGTSITQPGLGSGSLNWQHTPQYAQAQQQPFRNVQNQSRESSSRHRNAPPPAAAPLAGPPATKRFEDVFFL